MDKKNIIIISNKTTHLEHCEIASQHIGKKVVSKTGSTVGTVKELVFKQEIFVGFIVKGKNKLFIDKEYVTSRTKDSIMLSIDPVSELVGKEVFDADGKRIGKVSDIKRKSHANNISGLLVKRKFYSKPISIPKEDIGVFKENILLNKVYNKDK